MNTIKEKKKRMINWGGKNQSKEGKSKKRGGGEGGWEPRGGGHFGKDNLAMEPGGGCDGGRG